MAAEYQLERVRKIGKVGKYSYNVTIPKEIMQGLGWMNHQRVVFAQQGNTIVIRDWKPRKKGRS
jgi:antitoxin component of MazEF toxin-antitoxin module